MQFFVFLFFKLAAADRDCIDVKVALLKNIPDNVKLRLFLIFNQIRRANTSYKAYYVVIITRCEHVYVSMKPPLMSRISPSRKTLRLRASKSLIKA